MPDQLSREGFDLAARELIKTAPPGLTPEQFKTYIISNVRAKQYEGHENAGASYLGDMTGAAVDQVKTVAKSIPAMLMDPLGTTVAKITGHGETNPLAAAGNAVKGAVMAPVNIARAINTDDPRQAGREVVNAASFLPGYRALAAGAEAVPGVVSKVTPFAPRAVDAALGAVSAQPWQGAVRGAAGRGPMNTLLKSRAAKTPGIVTEAPAPPSAPTASGLPNQSSGEATAVEPEIPPAIEQALPPAPSLPAASKSKGATKMSENDMKVFTEAVQGGMDHPAAVEEMLKQRADRHAAKYGAAKDAAAAKKSGAIEKLAQQLKDVMKEGSH